MLIPSIIIRDYSIVFNGRKIFSDPEKRHVGAFLTAAYDAFGIEYPKFYKMDAMSKAGFLAAELLLRDHPVSAFSSGSVGIILSNHVSSLDTDRRFAESMMGTPSPALFVYTLPNIVIGEISIRHKLRGENIFFLTEGFDAGLLVEYAMSMFSSQTVDASLAGWVDVLDDHHDVFLYLMDKNTVQSPVDLASKVNALYKNELWNN